MNHYSDAERKAVIDGDCPPDGERIVYVVDDDQQMSEYIGWLLRPVGWQVRAFQDPKAFLDEYVDAGPACLLTDFCMPGLNGLELQQALAARGIQLPIIMMSGQADIPTAVQAMRGGASDFLEKPFDGPALIERLCSEFERAEASRAKDDEKERAAAALATLTPRQRQVLEGLTAGKISKVIAWDLGLSPRTVEVHRVRLMQRLGAQSLSDLFRLVYLACGHPDVTHQERDGAELSS